MFFSNVPKQRFWNCHQRTVTTTGCQCWGIWQGFWLIDQNGCVWILWIPNIKKQFYDCLLFVWIWSERNPNRNEQYNHIECCLGRIGNSIIRSRNYGKKDKNIWIITIKGCWRHLNFCGKKNRSGFGRTIHGQLGIQQCTSNLQSGGRLEHLPKWRCRFTIERWWTRTRPQPNCQFQYSSKRLRHQCRCFGLSWKLLHASIWRFKGNSNHSRSSFPSIWHSVWWLDKFQNERAQSQQTIWTDYQKYCRKFWSVHQLYQSQWHEKQLELLWLFQL